MQRCASLANVVMALRRWSWVELRLVTDRAAGALQEQVGAFTAGEFALGAEVTCHVVFLEEWFSDARFNE